MQKRANKNKRSPALHKAPDKYLLSTKLFCGYCKKPIIADSGKGHMGVIYKYYKCFTKKKEGNPCEKKQINKKYVEDLVVTETMKLLMIDGMIEKIARQVVNYNEQRRENTDLEKYEKQLENVKSQIANFMEMIGKGIFTDSMKDKLLTLESDKADLLWRIDGEQLTHQLNLFMTRLSFGSCSLQKAM